MFKIFSMANPLITILLGLFLFKFLESQESQRLPRGWVRLPFLLIQYGATLYFFVTAFNRDYTTGYLQWFAEHVITGDSEAQLSATGLLLLVGGLLYLLRRVERRIYGLLELAFAMVTAYGSLKYLTQWQSVSGWVPIAGAVYLVVRGLDNLVEGIKAAGKAKKEAAVKAVAP